MTMIERGRQFGQWLRTLVQRTPWDERQCVHCGSHETWKHGSYRRRPWTLAGRQTLTVQRYRCQRCRRTFTPDQAVVARHCWYGRQVQRCAVDAWQHGGSSLRRSAGWVRSVAGQQERWWVWQPWAAPAGAPAPCRLSASSVWRWLDRAGQRAEAASRRGLADVPSSGLVATDGLWAKLTGQTRAVVLLLADRVSGVVYPPVVAAGEDDPASWGQVFLAAAGAGLRVSQVRGIVSDGSRGLAQCVDQRLGWLHHQRCVFHLWRNLATPLREATTAAVGSLRGAAATAVRQATRRELAALVHAVLDAADDRAAVAALQVLAAHRLGTGLARALRNDVEQALVYQTPGLAGLGRVGPEWLWRDFRLRLSHGRNHRTDVRLARAAVRWAVYHNLEPTQGRKERRRRYRHPGQCPLAVAGVPPGPISYLDVLAV